MTPTATLPGAPTSATDLAQNAATLKPGQTVASFKGERFVGEPKLDGWRLLAHRTENGVHLYSRSAQSYTGSLPKIEAEIAATFPPGTWLDGEAVALRIEGGQLVHDWASVQSVLGSGTAKAAAQSDGISYMVFDLLAHGDIDARGVPFAKRRELLERAFEGTELQRLILIPQLQPTEATVDALLAQGFEGMVVKDRQARYASGKRGHGWTKIKPATTEDVVVMGFKPGENGFAGMVGAVVFGQYVEGELVERGRCSGMNMQTRKAMTADPDAWLGTVIEISRWDIMESGSFRHPQMKRKRSDKAPHECTWTVDGA